MLGSVWHAAWAGIPLGLCVIAFVPVAWFEKQGLDLGHPRGAAATPTPPRTRSPGSTRATTTTSRSTNEPDADGQKRTLVLDNLIHGYFILGHPERLDYDYEHIYALVATASPQAKAKAEAEPQGDADRRSRPSSWAAAPTPSSATCSTPIPAPTVDVAEIDPAVTRANHKALGLPRDTPIKTIWGDARQFVEKQPGQQAVRPRSSATPSTTSPSPGT